MANVYDKMREEGITPPMPPLKGGIYTPVCEFGTSLLYCSDYGPDLGGSTVIGRLGRDLTAKEGQKAAYNCALNLLASIEVKISNLNKIRCFVKVLVFVNSADDFVQRPQVMNGASSLLVELLGEEIGCPAHSAIGISTLPGGIACEIKMLPEAEAQSVLYPITEHNIFRTLSL